MLPKILSILSSAVFAVIMVLAIIAVSSQIMNRPLVPFASNNKLYPVVKPGILVVARKQTVPLVDSATVTINVTDSTQNSITRVVSMKDIRNNTDPEFEKAKDSLRALMGIKSAHNKQLVRDDDVTEKFLLVATSGWQRAGFALYDAGRYCAVAFIFYFLAQMFRNFGKPEYFTLANIALVRKAGWLMLVPQVLLALVFWIFLSDIQPANVEGGLPTESFAFYDVYAYIDWEHVLETCGLLVFCTVLKNGRELLTKLNHTV